MALRAVREDRPDDFLGILRGINLRTEKVASLQERWLAAEAAYRCRDYAQAIACFALIEGEPEFLKAPAWQRYLSSHRRCFAHFQRGEFHEASRMLREARERHKVLPNVDRRESHLEAMQGHFLELRGEFEQARSRFQIAYEQAHKSKNWNRAASAAADVGRIHGILGRPADGLSWVTRAEEAARKTHNVLIDRTIQVRRALLYMASGRYEEAEDLLDDLISVSQDGQTPEVVMSAYEGRADLHQLQEQNTAARRVLQLAIDVAKDGEWRRHEAYLRLALANLLLDQGEIPLAREQFFTALHLSLQLDPPQPKVLVDLATDVLDEPRLAGNPSQLLRKKLQPAVDRMKESIQVSLHRHAIREKRFKRDFENLLSLMQSVTTPK